MGRYLASCDIGGTFTDVVLYEEERGSVRAVKRLTTPEDPALAMLAGLADFAEEAPGYPQQTARLAHATTLVTNAVIERKGARTALLCTAGFRDVLQLRRYVRVTTYELFVDPPQPLVPRALRLSVNERTRADGRILRPVDPAEIAAIAERLKAEAVESVAICFLHAFTNPANERAAARLLAERLPGTPISLSSDVLPQIKEFERSSTTVVNAYVKPLARRYLGRVGSGLSEAGFGASLQIMLSNGGIGSLQTAAEYPVRLIESGPVAGAIVACHFARLLGLSEVLSFDMGGTTAKACLISECRLPLTDALEVARSRRFTKASGFPVAIPSVDMIEIGAGGGSIAAIGPLGIVEVGPESAGSVPGPVCYGRGGAAPTVTDADLVLGYLDPERFAGGAMRLDAEAARAAIKRRIAAPLGVDEASAASIVHNVVNETMAAAVRMHVTERGGDPSRPVLIAFGGAGPMHVGNLAQKLGIREVVVPERPGVLSALGLLLSPAAFDLKRTRKEPLDRLDPAVIRDEVAEMKERIARRLAEVAPGLPPRFDVTLEIGYIGQGYQVPVTVSPEDLAALTPASLVAAFAEVYRGKYGYFYDDVPAELVNIAVAGQAGEPPDIIAAAKEVSPASASPRAHRQAWSPRRRALVAFAVYDREALLPGMSFAGPAVIEESSATTVVDADACGKVDRFGSLVITLPGDSR